MLEVVGKESGLGGYEDAARLPDKYLQNVFKPLRRCDIPPTKMQGLILIHLENYGGKLLAARHAATTPPALLTIPAFLEQQGIAVRTNVMAMGEGSIMAMIDQRVAERLSAAGIKREGGPLNGEPKKSAPSEGMGLKRPKCYPALVGEECKRADCQLEHVLGEPGVDPCPWRDNCRRGAQCHLSWSHTTAGP